MLSGLQEKQLSIEYKIVQADGSTPIKEINVWFFLRKKMVEQKKEAMEQRVAIKWTIIGIYQL
jgi:hypothetical protein